MNFDDNPSENPNEKAFMLLQAYFFRLELPSGDFNLDMKLVVD